MLKSLGLAVLSTLTTLGIATQNAPRSAATDPSGYDPRDVYYRDVVIVGGGSSGIYSAMRLRDHGKTVMTQALFAATAEHYVSSFHEIGVTILLVIFNAAANANVGLNADLNLRDTLRDGRAQGHASELHSLQQPEMYSPRTSKARSNWR
ncbi:hypothetical protein PG997_002522 [Apiospora hydei]|uniref:Uncharacterized protein n=1 Tax=Apiospora hydei TaxID=1337664 RepID=A0ABR1WWL8_9PEZI